MPVRIELFGDSIDSIRSFDVLTQRSISSIKEISISRVSDMVITKEMLDDITRNLENLVECGDINSNLKENISKDIELIENGMLDNLTDKYFNLLVKNPCFFTDYLKDYNIFIDEPENCKKKADSICYENAETLKILDERNYMYIPFANKYISYDDVIKRVSKITNIYMQKQVFDSSINKKRVIFDFNSKEMFFYKSSFETLLNDVKALKNKKILLVFPSQVRVEQVKNYLLDNNVSVEVLDNIWREDNLKKSKVYITYGIVSGGFYSSIQDLVVIAEPVSGTNVKRKVKREFSKGTDIESFEDLKIDDFVVHENHGIGIYKGISSINVQEVVKDYIKIEYANNGVLYVPINQLDLVKKYVCDDSSKPKINSLGTKEWEKTKKKVTAHVEEIAKELLSLYAKREKNPGYAFSPDTPWQKEFEESFKYDLTDDQKQAVSEIKEDMESPRVMDRLLCGDVGYGKTEVALRVAFKAVMDKKQVAYLVPTTVLCLQQYRTFKERMEKFGIRVEMLSRFKTKKEQTDILKDLVDGKIDVLVGTHRMLSNDVFFKDLGLLIIDEEHRFGVKAKESIKKIKETVDVLSMTATPIPRTLHMSLVGIRDMSVLEEPPVDRHPIQTFVTEHNDEMIREAVTRELARNGQVYYVYNKVRDIEERAEYIQKLVPDAVVAYAHGQMDKRMLEKIMYEFVNGEIDVLVSTTIIETGMDIPNCNTMIIENADQFGLSQLYQLRGRVGRSTRTSYAFLMYKRDKMISEVAEKRLSAIKEFSDLGSGFKIAMKDLEIRGAGNVLGKSQHGHMAAVGYDLYCKMLNQAVNNLKGIKNEYSFETTVDLEVDAYIPASYIKSEYQKLDIYKRIAALETREELSDMKDELSDRYGSIPSCASNLLMVALIKSKAHKIGIMEIKGETAANPAGGASNWRTVMNIYPKADIDSDAIPKLLESFGGALDFKVNGVPHFIWTVTKRKFTSQKEYLNGLLDMMDIMEDAISTLQN